MITLRDVAKAAKVSVSTASYALNNRPEVNEETKKRVLEVASSMNYVPSGIAKDLKKRKTDTIGLILTNLSGPFYAGIIEGIEAVAYSSGYRLIICSSYGGLNSTGSNFLYEKRTDGVIIMASDIDDDLIKRAANEKFPIILLDRELNGKFIWSVMVDNKQGAYEAVSHLVGIGYKTIGYISGSSNSIDNSSRFEGYKDALKDNGLFCHAKWIMHGQFTKTSGYKVAEALIASEDLPEALFIANDEMAIGAIEAFAEAGIKVPERIAIVGYDDIELSAYVSPSLSTVQHPKDMLGRIAAQKLIQAFNKDFNINNIKLKTKLVIRESCGYKLKKSAAVHS